MNYVKIASLLFIFFAAAITLQAQYNVSKKNWNDTVGWINHHLNHAEHAAP
jgi:hypothetical protein